MEKQMLEMMQQILQKVSSLETKVDNIELKMNDGFETLELIQELKSKVH